MNIVLNAKTSNFHAFPLDVYKSINAVKSDYNISVVF